MTSAPDASTPLAVVTGASSGIGLSLARELVQRGYDVVVTAEDAELESAAVQLRGVDESREVVAVRADLSLPEGVTELYDAVQRLGRPVDVIALNAGIGVGGRFWETSLEDDLRLVDLNVRSTVHLAKLVVRDMVARGSGRVLVTASIAAKAPGPYHATYAASKAFVHSFAEGIRHELADTGVTVTSLKPGPTDTAFFERSGLEDSAIGKGPKDSAAKAAKKGYKALMKGKDQVTVGLKGKSQTGMARVLP